METAQPPTCAPVLKDGLEKTAIKVPYSFSILQSHSSVHFSVTDAPFNKSSVFCTEIFT